MLFNSYTFLLLFLPLTLLGTWCLRNQSAPIKVTWLILCSLFFYAYWSIPYLLFLFLSLGLNFFLAKKLAGFQNLQQKKKWLIGGIALNLLALGYFKYAAFLFESINYVLHLSLSLPSTMLPLAISFVTFQQIAFLVDHYRNQNTSLPALKYVLFIVFFPQLIAGPIVYFHTMINQYKKSTALLITAPSLAIGLSLFSIGLFKKVVLADSFAPFSDLVFLSATSPSFLEAWGGALCYTFQLYFDFSGYSDMAVGLAKIFHIQLPYNFNAPYKANSLIDFWRRWHITLSDFLKQYLYIPLGGNKKGKLRQYGNLILTMILGGLWHGAGFHFLLWGALHGIALTLNHLWRALLCTYRLQALQKIRVYQIFSHLLTFAFVVITWVFFKANDCPTAFEIIKGLCGLNGFVLPEHYMQALQKIGLSSPLPFVQINTLPLFQGHKEMLAVLLGFTGIWFFPSTFNLFQKNKQINQSITLIPATSFLWSSLLACMTLLSLLKMNHVASFLYYQF